MASKVVPALLLLGFLVIVIVSFHPTPLQSVALSVLHTKPHPGSVPDVKRYWMVFLKKGPNRNQSTTDAEKIQEAHMENIARLSHAGKLVIAGPFGNDGDLKGIFIMNCNDSTEVVQLINEDPAVKAGRLRFEVLSWWTEKNCVFK